LVKGHEPTLVSFYQGLKELFEIVLSSRGDGVRAGCVEPSFGQPESNPTKVRGQLRRAAGYRTPKDAPKQEHRKEGRATMRGKYGFRGEIPHTRTVPLSQGLPVLHWKALLQSPALNGNAQSYIKYVKRKAVRGGFFLRQLFSTMLR